MNYFDQDVSFNDRIDEHIKYSSDMPHTAFYDRAQIKEINRQLRKNKKENRNEYTKCTRTRKRSEGICPCS